ncbi:MAG: phosphate/phosphite/phosphonate ABC transporter substrate-binding protein [Bdellovibrionales bacterium]
MSCTKKQYELGSPENPIKFYVVPGQEIHVLKEASKDLKTYLEKELRKSFDVQVPTSYIALVEAFGTKRADVGIVNTFGYILAHEKYGATARLRIISFGRNQYFGQIIAHKDGPKSVSELAGKKFAFVDPASTSGYLLPAKLFKDRNIKPKEFVFAGRHDSVVSMVYQRQVDAGATFHVPEKNEKGQPMDARRLVRAQFPDVDTKVLILEKTGPVPNDPVIFRKDFPPELQDKIVAALRVFVKTELGQRTFRSLFNVTDFEPTNDQEYDKVRALLKEMGRNAQDFL